MKKYNKIDKHMIFVGIIVPILAFFVSMSATFAYFTAKASELQASTQTAIIKVNFNETTKKLDSNVISDSAEIYPDDELIINTKIENSGTAPIFAIINFKLQVTKTDGTVETPRNKYYTLSDSSLKEILGVENNYTNQAFELAEKTKTSAFDITYKFDGANYGNEYKNATVNYQIKVHAVQTTNLTNITATNYLMDQAGYSNTKVLGNTIITGEPSIESPATIESVGDKTKNLFNKKSHPFYTNSSKLTYEETETGVKFINPAISSNGPYIAAVYNIDSVANVGANTVYISSDVKLVGVPKTLIILGYCDKDGSNRKTIKELPITSNGIHSTSMNVDANTYAGKHLCLWLYSIAYSETISIEAGSYVEYSNLMLSVGESNYEPYGKYKIPVNIQNLGQKYIYLDEPLRKIGDIADYIDLETGEVVRMVGKVGSPLSISKYETTPKGLYRHHMFVEPLMKAGSQLLGYSNILPINSQLWDSWTKEQIHLGQANAAIYIITENPYSSWEDLKNYLTNNGQTELEILYQLATPTISEKVEGLSIPEGSTITVQTTIQPSNNNS